MTSASTVGREPVTIVEIEQPRCALRFGVGDCSATGNPKCYNTYSTCPVKNDYDGSGSIRWRCGMDRAEAWAIGDFSDDDNIKTNVIPMVTKVSTSKSQLNPGSHLDGKSPFGVTGKVTVSLNDIPWNDHVGDHYIADRSWHVAGKVNEYRSDFWKLFMARNKFLTGMFVHVYDGYVGQDFDQFNQRSYTLNKIDGPNAGGGVTITGLDPLRLADKTQAEFPRTSNLSIVTAIDATTSELTLFGDAEDLTDQFGDAEFILRIDDEFISFDGFTTDADGYHVLSNVVRAVEGSEPVSHDLDEKVQRCGVYRRILPWVAVDDLLRNHTPMPAEFLDIDAWNDEGGVYLPTSFITRIVSEPTPVEDLVGTICQQSLIYIWWAEYARKVKMLAVRPPDSTPVTLSDDSNLMDGTTIKAAPKSRLTRVAIYYGLKGQTRSTTDPANYKYRYVVVDGETEGGIDEPVTKSIYADWVTLRTQAAQVAFRLLARYLETPRFVSVKVDAKDRSVSVGSIVVLDTDQIVDTEGNIDLTRWQVTSAAEMIAGDSYILDLQTFTFAGRFGRFMADGSPNYTAATQDQKDTGAFYAGSDGLLSNGDKGYQYQ